MEKLPLTVLTGFLGSGKTTLLNGLLKTPELANSAVLINEFGEVALDHHLIETAAENTVVLDNGCICCTVRGALSGALNTLFWRRQDKEIPAFQRVIIETTGLADPAPIIHELLAHPTILHYYRLAGVIACVDGVFGATQLDRQPEALKQAAVADRLLITKTDIADTGQIDLLTTRLRELNPAAGIALAGGGKIDTSIILDATAYDPLSKNLDVQQWLKAETYRQVKIQPGSRLRKKLASAVEDINRNNALHDPGIKAFCLTFEQPVPWDGLKTGLEILAMVRGEQLLRIKGIVDAEGEDKPRVIHGVQSMFFPFTTLNAWPEGKRETRLVFIVRDMDTDFIEHTLDHFIEATRNGSLEETAT